MMTFLGILAGFFFLFTVVSALYIMITVPTHLNPYEDDDDEVF